jgi:hypothetical protein
MIKLKKGKKNTNSFEEEILRKGVYKEETNGNFGIKKI